MTHPAGPTGPDDPGGTSGRTVHGGVYRAFWNRGGWWRALGVAYLVIFQLLGLLTGLLPGAVSSVDDLLASPRGVVVNGVLPTLIGVIVLGWLPRPLLGRSRSVLPVLIVAGVMFIRWAGWSRQVWRTSGAGETQPRRWWMLAIPVLLLVHIATIFAQVPWGDRSGTLIVVVLAGTAMVGFGEELYFRGILRATIRAHHGEFVTLLVTSLLFGLAHSLSSLLAGLPPTFVAFQVAATALDGAVLYGVFRATGRLWAAILLHGLNDAALYLVSADTTNPAATAFNPGSWFAITPTLLWALTAALVISCLREDLHARASRKHLTR